MNSIANAALVRKYSLVQCLSFHCLNVKNIITFFLCLFGKPNILVFLGLVLSIQELQYEDELSLVSFGSKNGSDKILLNEKPDH